MRAGGQTDSHEEANAFSAILRKRPKIRDSENHNRDVYHAIWKAALLRSSFC